MKIDFNKILRNEKIALMSDTTFRMTMDLLKAIDANDVEEILNIMIVLDDETAPETIDKILEIDKKRNATVTENVTDTVTRNAKSNAERQKRYRERNKKRNENVTRNVTENVTDTVTRNVMRNENVTDTVTKSVTRNENVTLPQEERENEKEEEKERTKEKEEERVKEKEKLINIYATEKSEKPKKHKYGNFQHVFLTDDDYQRLAADFNDLPERIQRLDDYLENNPSKHYANHNLTIRNWAKKDSSQTPKEIPKEKTFRDLRIEMENQEREQDASQDYFVDSFWRA